MCQWQHLARGRLSQILSGSQKFVAMTISFKFMPNSESISVSHLKTHCNRYDNKKKNLFFISKIFHFQLHVLRLLHATNF